MRVRYCIQVTSILIRLGSPRRLNGKWLAPKLRRGLLYASGWEGGARSAGPQHLDLLNVLHQLGERGVGFKSLVDTWADTTTPHGRLMLTVLGGLAEFERELIQARTGEGRKRAMAKGVKFGRPRKLNPHQRQEALKRIADGETYTAIARSYAVDPNTISRLDRVGA